MLLRKIILENYGLYAGKVELDLLPRVKYGQERPIILVGGKNGTGKTTFLDAIRLVLYGKAILGNRVSQNDYEDFLREHVHRDIKAIIAPEFARVALEFDYVTAGEQKTYFVERSWTAKKTKGVKEYLQIKVDGKELENVSDDFWQGFVEEIIPERLSQLFFFDGEKIKSIADDNDGSQVLADAIKTLLGLDVVERLKADLSIFMGREIKKSGAKTDKDTWQDFETKINQAKEEIGQKIDELARVRTSITGVLADIKNKETRLHQEGHHYATRRDELKIKQSQLTTRIEEIENQIRLECEKTFPFTLCPSISTTLRTQLQEEKRWKRLSMVRDELASVQGEILSNTNGLDKKSRLQVEGIIKAAFATRFGIADHLNNTKEIHGLSDASADQVLSWLDEAENQSQPNVKKAGQQLANLQRQLQETTKDLSKSPDEAQTLPLFDDLSLLNQRLGKFQQEERQIKAEISQNENKLIALQREQRRHIDRQVEQDGSKGRLSLVNNIQNALITYQQRLIEVKIDQLRQAVTQGFNCLSQKGDMISDIAIAQKSFAVTLFDKKGTALPKKILSAGEKQLFAIAMLWGLAKTSGRPLPVIIDTPLGRLDSDHRRNLIENYFPMASHQVILLSTDTEVDQQLYKQLSPQISHSYHLRYDKDGQLTEPREEYFWKESRECQN
ncbi:MAG: DNA sulfur modification protein DndD [Deltaproteobacteria bacterium RIFOXYD12_FULL_53_23]|nr:MAG: DNA sulfur modification protein DndD [Deltaproteobacteria bacterium RIFOXYD12_FULL_53_23]